MGVNTSTGRRKALGIGECLRRLNDSDEQMAAYPLLDEFEKAIDLAGTDILHGWRYSGPHGLDVRGEPFADAFANAFRVMVLRRDTGGSSRGYGFQPVFRRVGWSGSAWVWQHTSVITSWSIEMSSGAIGPRESVAYVEEIGREERLLGDGAAACERARDILAMGGEQGRDVGVRIRGQERLVDGPDENEEGA